MHNFDYLIPFIFWLFTIAGFLLGAFTGFITILKLKDRYDSKFNNLQE